MKIKFDNFWGCGDFHLITIGFYQPILDDGDNHIYIILFNVGISLNISKR